MELVNRSGPEGLQVTLIRGLGAERACAEQELLDAHVPLALSDRMAWATYLDRHEAWFLLVRDATGRACAGVAIEKVRTRAMPGHLILHIARFGRSLSAEVCKVLLEAAARLARKAPRVLRLQVNVFSLHGRETIALTLKELGFHEVQRPSTYRHTLTVDLIPSEDEIFATFDKSARNLIRASKKKSLRSQVITDPAYAARLKELQLEALQRTGGHSHTDDWQTILSLSREHPSLSGVFGLFVGEDTAPESMAAFGWVCNHGDHGEYRAAGSTRRGDTRIPFGYLLLWDMICWSKATGAEWFDMGGVTLADSEGNSLQGISSFKRCFSRQVAEVGAEWVLDAAPVRSRIANVISNRAKNMRNWVKKKA
jgi:hypothetical protein